MPDRLPSTLDELYEMVSALDVDLTRSRTIMSHLPLGVRPEAAADYCRRMARHEAIALTIGLPTVNVGVRKTDVSF